MKTLKPARSAIKPKALRALAAAVAACLVALSLSGCASGASSGSPWEYSIDPDQVDAEGSDATSAALVVATAQGQSFRLPESALAYAKSAIEKEGYVSVTRADDAVVHSNVYKLTKTTEAGRRKELAANLADYFDYACGSWAETEGVRLLDAINAAANDLQANGTGDKKVLAVVGSGLSESGDLVVSQELLSADVSEVVGQLAANGAIADYSGIEFRFYGVGQSTGGQDIPSSVAVQLEELLSAIVVAGGGEAAVCTDQLTPIGNDDELPAVEIVDFDPDVVDVQSLKKEKEEEVVLDDSLVSFVGDSSEFADEAAARETISEVAQAIVETGATVAVVGHTADTGAGDGMALSEERAQAVAAVLREEGVADSQITAVEGVGCAESTSFAGGVFNEDQAKKDRKVVLSLSL